MGAQSLISTYYNNELLVRKRKFLTKLRLIHLKEKSNEELKQTDLKDYRLNLDWVKNDEV